MSIITLPKLLLMASATALMACGGGSAKPAPAPAEARPVPTFNADSAYAFVAAQTAFGPRVPGSEASARCAQWLQDKLAQYGASAITAQQAPVTAYNGDKLPAVNITAQFNPSARKRVLLMAHWDSRPWADQDPDPQRRNQPIDGANDGASGVGVILELARAISQQSPSVGVDVLFADAEDYGRRDDDPAGTGSDDSWCLGTQYWVDNPTLDLRAIRYAVLLDMVGAKDAVFAREYISQSAAGDINDKVWRAAAQAGHSGRFVDAIGGAVVDDHVYLLRAGIPAIDVIESAHPQTGTFNPAWHTHADNIEGIDPATLQAVGDAMMQLIYSE